MVAKDDEPRVDFLQDEAFGDGFAGHVDFAGNNHPRIRCGHRGGNRESPNGFRQGGGRAWSGLGNRCWRR